MAEAAPDILPSPPTQAAHSSRGRRAVRWVGTLLAAVGLLGVAWVIVVWQWQDPFTYFYMRHEQHVLARQYEQRLAQFHPAKVRARALLGAVLRKVAVEAGRYRLASHEGEAIGRILVPRMGVNLVLVNGTDHGSLMKGPGRDLRTFMPGEGRLVYIAGHRTTFGAPFAHIDSLRPGDLVRLEMPYATIEYRITHHVVVPAGDVSILRSRGYEQVALQACHPRFFATHRYVAYGRPAKLILPGGRAYVLKGRIKGGSGPVSRPASRQRAAA